jgi:uncharacterized delta-60 repeat protein
MALNATGAISLGGSTTGQSIAVELSRSSTATISLNDTVVRTLANVSSGTISLYNLYSRSTVPYWIGTLGSASYKIYGNGVAVDSSGNVYVCGTHEFTSTNVDGFLAKYNSSGTIQWQRRYGDNDNSSQDASGIAVDSSGNVYTVGSFVLGGYYRSQILLSKYNSSGTIQWQKHLGSNTDFGTADDYGNSVAVDSSGNVYVVGTDNWASMAEITVAKYDSSGTIQWQRGLNGTYSDGGSGITVDSSGNVYIVGATTLNASGYSALILAKYNSSGSVQWQQRLGNTTTYTYGGGIAIDSSGNLYVVGTSSSHIVVAKYNNSGTIQWQRSLSSSYSDYGIGVAVDSSGNVYISGYGGGPNQQCIIAKYDSSGSIQWQRNLSNSSLSVRFNKIAVDSSGNIHVFGFISGSPATSIVAKFPGNGSYTGTYTVGSYSFTYDASSLTDATSSITNSSTSLGTYNDVLTSIDYSSYTSSDAAETLTSTITKI